ncbi:MAG TPA: YggS family pyridoxal phosphate-dependent enzyme [Polyangiaceae bacterium]|nr:YggS family pyridoxal phosphate-dependent enzyme [Polyangiaceae bacterium]
MTASPPLPDLAALYRAQLERIARATEGQGRAPDSVRLIAVSKYHPADAIRALYGLGQRDFGENYVQELTQKAELLADLPDLRWHLIGHLQSNKARAIAPWIHCVQTVASAKLALELGRRARERRPETLGPLEVLLEVNVGREPQKAGLLPEELGAVLEAVDSEPRLALRGLMAIPPIAEDPEGSRPAFAELASLRERWGGAARLPELSMGMSHDVEVAIAEGATMVRVGTALFGERPR